MGFKESLISNKPRETSGPTSSSRFDFQKDWSICQLLDYYNPTSDYLFIFDFHDDLVVLDSESSPTKISFYQIKGKKSGNWSLKSLLNQDKGKDDKLLLSIIGKLYYHKYHFKDTDVQVDTLNFISNAPFKINCGEEKKPVIRQNVCVVEIRKEEKDKIHEHLKEQFSLAEADEDFENATHLKVITLSLDDSSTHTKGKVADFLQKLIPNGKYNPSMVYQTLFEEVKKRTNYNQEIRNFDDLLTHKSLGKAAVDDILSLIGAKKDYDRIWLEVFADLNNELKDFDFSTRQRYRKLWTNLEIDRMNPSNYIVLDTIKKIRATISNNPPPGNSLKSNLDYILSLVEGSMSENIQALGKAYVETIILSEIYS